MNHTFLENTWAGYVIQQWADRNNLHIIRVRFNRRGAIVYHMEKR